jgi:flagellar FliL protein
MRLAIVPMTGRTELGSLRRRAVKKADMADTEPKVEQPAPKKSRGKLLFVIVAVVILLAGGGGGAYWWTHANAQTAESEDAGEETHAEAGMVSLEPFVVNLADTDSRRYLRINVRLIVDGVEAAEEIEHHPVAVMRLRAAVLELLTQQTASAVQSAEGKTALKKSIAERAAGIIKPTEVSDVLFSDFVVQ